MNQDSEKRHRSGVACLFCGRRTPLPTSEGRRVLIIRCRVCGKEAPYEASRITEFQEGTNGAKSARAAGRG
jgi:translation initiation factor 2 beta subunit (eIF-2beta)/eIF-5